MQPRITDDRKVVPLLSTAIHRGRRAVLTQHSDMLGFFLVIP